MFPLKARLVDFWDLIPEVRHFVFEALGVARLEFEPGQFVSLVDEVEGREVTRAYSIASPPDGNRFELCLNRVRQGLMSPRLFEKVRGEELEMSGPLGYFVMRQPLRDSFFVAMGTGVAPIRSMLQHPPTLRSGRQMALLFGTRFRRSLLYDNQFREMASEFPNFRYVPTLTKPDQHWEGRTGRVQRHLLELVGDRRDVDVYICGLKEMVDDVRGLLKAQGFDRKRLIYEKYD